MIVKLHRHLILHCLVVALDGGGWMDGWMHANNKCANAARNERSRTLSQYTHDMNTIADTGSKRKEDRGRKRQEGAGREQQAGMISRTSM